MSEKLAHKSRSFFEIADDLATYFESLALVEAQIEAGQTAFGDPVQWTADKQEIQAQIQRLGAELATKADNVAGVLRRMKSERELLAAEEMRLTERRLIVERSEEWLKNYVMGVMRSTDQRVIRTERTTLRIQGNGGKQPVVVAEPDAVPAACKYATFTVRLDRWQLFQKECEEMAESMRISLSRLMSNFVRGAIEPSLTLIGEALAQPCVACHGTGEILPAGPSDAPVEICDVCHGSKTATVPGAHLEPRGEHLRIL